MIPPLEPEAMGAGIMGDAVSRADLRTKFVASYAVSPVGMLSGSCHARRTLAGVL